MQFANRSDAGRQLADKLTEYKDNDAVIFALPRGGVPVAKEVATQLNLPIGLLVPRKVGHPAHPEYAICAVTEKGRTICNDSAIANLDPDWLQGEIANQRQEASRRRKLYLAGKEPQSAKDKTVIIVDDGIATGLTMRAAIADVKDYQPSKIIVAIPAAPLDTIKLLENKAHQVITVLPPNGYLGSVGAYYRDFPQVQDDEVLELLR